MVLGKNIAVPVIYSSIKSCLYSNHLHHDTGYKLFCALPPPAPHFRLNCAALCVLPVIALEVKRESAIQNRK